MSDLEKKSKKKKSKKEKKSSKKEEEEDKVEIEEEETSRTLKEKKKKKKEKKKRKHEESQQGEEEAEETSDVVAEKDEGETAEKLTEESEEPNNGDEKGAEEGEEPGKRKRKRKRKKKNPTNDDGTGANEAGKDNEGPIDKTNSLDHTVYVEGIPFDCTEEEVKGFFVDNGCEDVLQMRLPRWQDSGRLRGYGHIVFDTVESRSKALSELNGRNLRSRYLNIQEAKPQGGVGGRSSGGARAQPENCRTVFVKNLPYNDITEEDVHTAFRSCGKIVEGGVRLARNYSTKQLKGFGYIEFKNPEGAYSAVQRSFKGDGIKLSGRACYVDYEEGTMKGSYRNEDGKLWQKKHGSAYGK